MQLIYRYLVNNKVLLTADLAGEITEYKSVYQRNIKIYRGIDNLITFQINNADQKPIAIDGIYTPTFYMYDENSALVVSKQGVIIETADSSVYTNKGQFTVTLTENDLIDLKSQYLSYTVWMTSDVDNSRSLTYANTHFDNKGVIYLDHTAFPGPLNSYSVTTFAETGLNTDIFISETISGQPSINGNSALHTAAVYNNDADATVTIQGTLDNQVTGSTDWADITTINITNSDTIKYANFNGVFNHIRFKYEPTNSGSLNKVLVRN
jgi:hypothetical protein